MNRTVGLLNEAAEIIDSLLNNKKLSYGLTLNTMCLVDDLREEAKRLREEPAQPKIVDHEEAAKLTPVEFDDEGQPKREPLLSFKEYLDGRREGDFDRYHWENHILETLIRERNEAMGNTPKKGKE